MYIKAIWWNFFSKLFVILQIPCKKKIWIPQNFDSGEGRYDFEMNRSTSWIDRYLIANLRVMSRELKWDASKLITTKYRNSFAFVF